MPHRPKTSAALLATLLLGGLLIAVLALHLLMPLLAGLTAYALHRWLLRVCERRLPPRARQPVAMLLFWLVLAAAVTAAVLGVRALHLGSPSDALARLTTLMADSLDRLRTNSPPWMVEHLPDSIASLRDAIAAWLREHAAQLRTWGAETARAAAHLLVGLVVGLLASAQGRPAQTAPEDSSDFLVAWRIGLARLARAFTDVVGAQVRIAAINTAFTAVFLLVVIPLLGERMPLTHTLVLLTFIAGLIPVLGNLASNSAIVLAALTVSPSLALLALLYLVAIHKLEYFLNARFVGGAIHARTYEILAAMLLLDAVFGLHGVVAAPIYYAWMTGTLRDEGLM
jgi:predicted PurR-regulated permease PerM